MHAGQPAVQSITGALAVAKRQNSTILLIKKIFAPATKVIFNEVKYIKLITSFNISVYF